MKLLDYTTENLFLPKLKSDGLEGCVNLLVAELAAEGHVTENESLAREVMRRENEGSTAIGDGLVIPHARFRGVKEVRVAVATLADPLDLAAEDGQPVDIVILLVGPEGDPRLMLRVLARLARLVKNHSFTAELRRAETRDELRLAFSLAAEESP